MTISVPDTVLAIQQRLEAAGFETWCVGGAVRDALLGIPQSDIDLATSATPTQIRDLFPRTIPIGIEHGTVGVLDPDGELHEVTTFRRDVHTDGRHAVVEFGVSLDDDLARRDFTINAIAWHPGRREYRDPFGGNADLESGIVRAVGRAADRFQEDRLRILRAFRFAARFGFRIDEETWQAAVAQAGDTRHLSAERVREEWWKGMQGAADPAHFVRLWEESGVAEAWLASEHSVPCSRLDNDPLLTLASLRTPVEPVLRRLKCSTVEIGRGRAIDRGPETPVGHDAHSVRRWLSQVGPAADDLAAVHSMRNGVDGWWVAEGRAIRERGEPLFRTDLAVTGDDLLREGVATPGPVMGKLLERLLAHVLAEPDDNDRERLLEIARQSPGR